MSEEVVKNVDVSDIALGIDSLKLDGIAVGALETSEIEVSGTDEAGISSSKSQESINDTVIENTTHEEREEKVFLDKQDAVRNSVQTGIAIVTSTTTHISTPPPKISHSGRPPIPKTPSTPADSACKTPSKAEAEDSLRATTPPPPSRGASFDSSTSSQGSTLGYETPPESRGRSKSKDFTRPVLEVTDILRSDSGVTKCFIGCNYNVSPPIFTLFKESSNTFLLSAGKISYGMYSSYLISKDPQFEFDRKCKSLVGELQCDMMGLQYNLYGTGRSPWNIWSTEKPRELLTGISYTPNFFFDAKDRAITVNLHARGTYGLQDNADRDESATITLKNREPVWNESAKCYILDFRGRAKLPSAKNFQLVDAQNPDVEVFQMGKYSDTMFTVDVRWPLSLFDAFAIALTSLDSSEE